jgi:hypothetical protein
VNARGLLLASLAFLWLSTGALADEGRKPQPSSFLSAVEPSEVELGRPFVLRVEIRHPKGERYRLPADLDLGVIVRDVQAESVERDGLVQTTFRIEALVFDRLGEIVLPDLRLEVEDDEGPLAPLLVPGATVKIRETGEGTELAPPPDPLEVRVFAWERLAIAAAVLALLGVIWALWRRRGGKAAAKPALPPAEAAIRALGELRAETLWERGEGRLHYFRLSEIVRVYLRDGHGMAAPEMTSDELLAALQRWPVPGLSVERMEAWLRRGDLIRFAKGEVQADRAMRDCDEAREMIEAMEGARPAAQGGAGA